MSRRRKRKKLNPLEDKDTNEQESSSSSKSETKETSHVDKTLSKEADNQKLSPQNPVINDEVVDELEIELGDEFLEEKPSAHEKQSPLPSMGNKREPRTLKRSEAAPDAPAGSELPTKSEEPTPRKKHRITQSAIEPTRSRDEFENLDEIPVSKAELELEEIPIQKDELLEKIEEKTPNLDIADVIAPEIESSVPEPLPEETPTPSPAAKSPLEESSLSSIFKRKLGSLALYEKASLGMLLVILVAAAIWSSSVVSARIPNTVIASKLKYPLAGDSAVLASFDSYWRSPIREGDNIDEGVPESIELIPLVKVSLDPKSKAKSLRFLFRDEEGRYVGDSSTVRISGTKFLPSENVTAVTEGNTATIRSTTGFELAGELISYLADENFQWEVVILESKDGVNYTEFMAIPISANRKDNS